MLNCIKKVLIFLKFLFFIIVIIFNTHIILQKIVQSHFNEKIKKFTFFIILGCSIFLIYKLISKLVILFKPYKFKSYFLIDNNIYIAKYNIINNQSKINNIKINNIYFEKCIICYNNKSNIILPCTHHNFCFECIDKINKCPLCRKNIYTRFIYKD